jgi:hypothetical protein
MVLLHQDQLEGLRSRELTFDSAEVAFALVFSNLPPVVTVYPSENYYYFILRSSGRELWGNICLPARRRDQGVLSFACVERPDLVFARATPVRLVREFGAKDGVTVERRALFEYRVAYRGRAVTFRLHPLEQQAPKTLTLRADEVLVERTLDESGYPFCLLFNTLKRYFLWVLDEDSALPDVLTQVDDVAKLHQEVQVGKLSGFVFWVDALRARRKVLVAVRRTSVTLNDYYDGPFDQLADNHVDQSRRSEYMQQAFPALRGQIDKFGYYTNQPGAQRVALTCYATYVAKGDLIDFLTRAFLAEDPLEYAARRGLAKPKPQNQ